MPSSTLPSWTVSLAGDGVSSSTGKEMVTALGGETSSKIVAASGQSSLRRGQRPIFVHRNRPATGTSILNTTTNDLTTKDNDGDLLEAVEKQDKEARRVVVVDGERSSTAFSSPRTVLFSPKTTEAFPFTTKTAAVADTELASTTIMIARLPAFAWKLHEKCRHEMFRRNLTWALVNLQMIVASAITITAAVLYGRYYTGYPFPLRLTDGQQEQSADPLAIALFGCTIVLPLYVTYLVKVRKTLADAPNPFPETMARVESEIYQFRTRVGPYKDSSSSTCREVFTNRAKELWSKAASELTTTTTTSRRLELSNSFWEDDDERDADVGVKMYRQRRSSPDDDTRYSSHETTAFSQLPIPPTPTTSLQPTETTPMLLSLSPSENSNTSSKAAKQQEFYSKDPRSLLPLDVYPSLRLCKMIKKKSDQIASWEFREQLITRIIQVVTLAATCTALLSLQWIVPILLAATAASASLLELGNFARAIQVETKTLEQLNDINKRWKALEGEDLDDDDEEKQQQQQQDHGSNNGDRQALVEEAEAQILSGVMQMHS